MVLQKLDKSMCWGILLLGGKDILRNGEKDARIFPEDIDVKYFLGITQA